jgi:hypothetical protein
VSDGAGEAGFEALSIRGSLRERGRMGFNRTRGAGADERVTRLSGAPRGRSATAQSATPNPQPPSITISCPVMYSEARDERNRASALMSSG